MEMTHLFKKSRFFNCFDPVESLRCFRCKDFETFTLVDLKRHFKAGHRLTQSEEKLYLCDNCSFQTHSKYLYLRHEMLDLCLMNEKIEPKTLNSEVTREFQLQRENRTDDLNDFQLNLRNKSDKRKLYKCEHWAKATKCWSRKSQWFECEHCPYKTNTKSNWKQHMAHMHGDRTKCRCEHCDFERKFKDDLKAPNETRIRWFECEHCSHRTKTKFELKTHICCKHENAENLRCDHCQFETKLKSNLKKHVSRRHANNPDKIKWFECEHCSYKTRTNSNLKKHVVGKHGDDTFRCDRCKFETKYKHILRNHGLIKHADPESIEWFHCKHCQFRSKSRGNLKRHVDCMHGMMENFKCDHCEFQTKTKYNLKNHILLKHADPAKIEWFHCAHCEYQTRIKRYLQKHLARHQ